jgi:LytS/YehU family sensor histidine kinase
MVYLLAHAGVYYFMAYSLAIRWLRCRHYIYLLPAFLLLAALASGLMLLIFNTLLKGKLAGASGEVAYTGLFITFFSSIVIVDGLLLGARATAEAYRQQVRNEELERERLRSELQYLKAQVNPHFLFNAINSIYVLIQTNPKLASETLLHFSELLRMQLYGFSDERIDIADELSYLDNYIAIEMLRKGNRVQFFMQKEESLCGFYIPPLLLLPFLENCFKHVSDFADKPNQIRISIGMQSGRLRAVFFNTCDHSAWESSLPATSGGLGIKNVRRRLELIYGDNFSLEIKQGTEHYEAELNIPIYGH